MGIKMRMDLPLNQLQVSASVAPHFSAQNTSRSMFWKFLAMHTTVGWIDENRSFFDPDQTLMPQLPFLDSLKPDQYGPRGF
jgi:hypothetical protein